MTTAQNNTEYREVVSAFKTIADFCIKNQRKRTGCRQCKLVEMCDFHFCVPTNWYNFLVQYGSDAE